MSTLGGPSREPPGDEEAFCPAQAAIQILQEKWVLSIVRALLGGPRGFNELARLTGGCNPATLSQRLGHLEEIGLLSKTVESYMPPRTLYALTPAGRALEAVLLAIEEWSRQYLVPGPGGKPRCQGTPSPPQG